MNLTPPRASQSALSSSPRPRPHQNLASWLTNPSLFAPTLLVPSSRRPSEPTSTSASSAPTARTRTCSSSRSLGRATSFAESVVRWALEEEGGRADAVMQGWCWEIGLSIRGRNVGQRCDLSRSSLGTWGSGERAWGLRGKTGWLGEARRDKGRRGMRETEWRQGERWRVCPGTTV